MTRVALRGLAARKLRAFTTMLATVLTGIAIGGAIATTALRRERDWTAVLIVVQLATAIAVLASDRHLSSMREDESRGRITTVRDP